jgi:ribosomal protein L37AE/L43A
MANYKEQVEWVKTLSIKEGNRVTTDCPFCGGKNKFSVDRFDGKLVWNCYRASCEVKGAYYGKRNIDAVKARLSGSSIKRHKPEPKPIPSITTHISNIDVALSYLQKVNSYEAYLRGDIKIRYAPKESRVLFYNKDSTGAVGRSMKPVRAKWWSYGELSEGIHVGTGDHAVLVEDVASACAVSNVDGLVGVALLGTNITKSIKKAISKYKKITLVLDNDASTKAVSLMGVIGYNSQVRFTLVDLKYLSNSKIREVVY